MFCCLSDNFLEDSISIFRIMPKADFTTYYPSKNLFFLCLHLFLFRTCLITIFLLSFYFYVPPVFVSLLIYSAHTLFPYFLCLFKFILTVSLLFYIARFLSLSVIISFFCSLYILHVPLCHLPFYFPSLCASLSLVLFLFCTFLVIWFQLIRYEAA
jgi:hypothetical protein